MKWKPVALSLLIITTGCLAIYYLLSYQPMPRNIVIDKITAFKSQHKLLAYSKGKLIKKFIISIGRNPVGGKQYEGDNKTPEGIYTINDKNHTAITIKTWVFLILTHRM